MSGIAKEITSYDELIEVLRARKTELQMSNQAIDHRAGLAEDATNKILGPRRAKKLGPVSLNMLEALGLRLFLLEDPIATARTLAQTTPRKAAYDTTAARRIASANG
jgi:hypothetical protein